MKGGKKSGVPDAKPQKTLLHFFQQQSQTSAPVLKVTCPACYLEVPQSKINWHLDQECKSKSNLKKTKDGNLAKRKKILKSVKNKIALKKKQKVMLSDDECDDSNLSEVEILDSGNDDEDSEGLYISSSMVETKIFEIDGEVDCTAQVMTPESSPLKKCEVTASPYFSPNHKNIAVSPLDRLVKTIDFQMPSTSRDSRIAMLELDWSSPNSTPTKKEEVRDAEIASSCDKVISPHSKSSSSKETPSENPITNSDSESENFEKNPTVYRTPKKVSKQYLNNSPKSLTKFKDVNENLHNKDKKTTYLSHSPSELKVISKSDLIASPLPNCSRTCEDSDDDFEENPIQFRSPNKAAKKCLKNMPNSSKKYQNKHEASPSNPLSISLSPVSNGSCGDSEHFCTPLHSPGLVSPTRSPSPLIDNVNTVSDNYSSVDTVNMTSQDTCVRKLFTPPNSPVKCSQKSMKSSPESSNCIFSESIRNNANRFSKVMVTNVGKGTSSDAGCGASSQSQGQESSSQSSQRSARIWVRTPRKINQSIKSSALLQNSPQRVSSSIAAKRSPSISPNKANSGSPDFLKDSEGRSLFNKYDKSMFRGHKGYYLENFLLILETVLSEPQDVKLFDKEDLSVIKDFHGLSLQAQKLYVRLFQRKIKWNKMSKIEYSDICDREDTELYVNELSYANFVLMETELCDLGEVMQLLSAEDLQGLCKKMKVPATGKKEDMANTLLKFNKQQRTIVSAFSKGSTLKNSVLLKNAKEIMGRCCIINKEVRRVFMRVLMLYGLPRYDEEEEKGQTQLTTLLLVNLGKMIFPTYNVSRQHAIFQSRDELIRFEGCSQMLADVQECIENQKWEEAINYCNLAKTTYQELINDQQLMDHDVSLPAFLRRFTSISVLVHILTCSVECYQRLRNYKLAVEQLQFLLNQKTHLQDYRGRWYDRLALNLEMHLKSSKAVEVICEALSDPEVRKGHRLALSIRAERMAASSRFKSLAPSILKLPLMKPRESPKVIIEGRCLPGDVGYKKVFIRQDSDRHAGEGEVTVCSVEELVLGYYKDQGYTKGLHREGTTVNSLFGLFFWDILYTPVPDAFRSPYQATPLDLDDPHFYAARKELIEKRLSQLNTWSEEEAQAELERIWTTQTGNISLVAWDIFRNLEYVKELVVCITLPVVASICRRLAEDHRFSRSGFPDLIVWDPFNKRCRIVEVKGPNDRLSTKQILWLDYLLENGAAAEVCHVEAIGAKKMKLASPRRISPKKRSPVKRETNETDHESAGTSVPENKDKKGTKRQRKQAKTAEEKEEVKQKKKPSPKKNEVGEGVKNKHLLKKKGHDDDFRDLPPRKRRQRK